MAEFHQNGKFERLKHDIPFRTQFAKNKQLKFKCGKKENQRKRNFCLQGGGKNPLTDFLPSGKGAGNS